jgi:hypothetical protein
MKTILAAALLVAALPLLGSSDRESLKQRVIEQPGDTDARYLLARTFAKEGFRGPAILEYLRFLALESSTPRSTDAARQLVALLNRGIKRKGGGETTIALDMNARTEEGEFGGWELFLGLAAATGDRQASEFERTRAHIATALSLLIESPARDDTYSHSRNVPFFAELDQKKLLETFAGVVLMPLKLKGEKEWVRDNEAAIGACKAHIEGLPR